eukprot:3028578-Pleurochrysis_carterae.AAC.1
MHTQGRPARTRPGAWGGSAFCTDTHAPQGHARCTMRARSAGHQHSMTRWHYPGHRAGRLYMSFCRYE